jgi:hypothetical protein
MASKLTAQRAFDSELWMIDVAVAATADELAYMIRMHADSPTGMMLLGVFDSRCAVARIVGEQSFDAARVRYRLPQAGNGSTLMAKAAFEPLSVLRHVVADPRTPDPGRSYLFGVLHGRRTA